MALHDQAPQTTQAVVAHQPTPDSPLLSPSTLIHNQNLMTTPSNTQAATTSDQHTHASASSQSRPSHRCCTLRGRQFPVRRIRVSSTLNLQPAEHPQASHPRTHQSTDTRAAPPPNPRSTPCPTSSRLLRPVAFAAGVAAAGGACRQRHLCRHALGLLPPGSKARVSLLKILAV